ncbi:MAG: hypothetical protein ACRYGP_08905 [Janthinobacterium lividum]
MRHALRHLPEHHAATAHWAAFLRITGKAEAGVDLLRSHFKREQANAGARLNPAANFLQEER